MNILIIIRLFVTGCPGECFVYADDGQFLSRTPEVVISNALAFDCLEI